MSHDPPVIRWAELCAGAAATTLQLLGGARVAPVCSYMGGKRRYAPSILAAMGLQPSQPGVESVLLCDAGPWGWVWPTLLDPETSRAVAEVLRGWESQDPRELWDELASKPPSSDLHERSAGWLWLQARAASGVPVWWSEERHQVVCADHATGRVQRAGQTSDWRMGEEPSKARRGDRTLSQTGGGRWEASNGDGDLGPVGQKDAGWVASDGRGDPRPAGQRGDHTWQQGSEGGRPPQPAGQRNVKPSSLRGCGGIMHPATLARRIETVADLVATWLCLQAGGWQGKPITVKEGRWVTHGYARPSLAAQSRSGSCWSVARVRAAVEGLPSAPGWSVYHGDAGDLVDALTGWATHVYIDPPYVGRTGYGWDIERERLLQLAVALANAGAVVAISEAEPLPLEGWHHVDLTSLGRRGSKAEWLTLSRPPASVPAEQLGLWSALCP